jgi:hypothetical protein
MKGMFLSNHLSQFFHTSPLFFFSPSLLFKNAVQVEGDEAGYMTVGWVRISKVQKEIAY